MTGRPARISRKILTERMNKKDTGKTTSGSVWVNATQPRAPRQA